MKADRPGPRIHPNASYAVSTDKPSASRQKPQPKSVATDRGPAGSHSAFVKNMLASPLQALAGSSYGSLEQIASLPSTTGTLRQNAQRIYSSSGKVATADGKVGSGLVVRDPQTNDQFVVTNDHVAQTNDGLGQEAKFTTADGQTRALSFVGSQKTTMPGRAGRATSDVAVYAVKGRPFNIPGGAITFDDTQPLDRRHGTIALAPGATGGNGKLSAPDAFDVNGAVISPVGRGQAHPGVSGSVAFDPVTGKAVALNRARPPGDTSIVVGTAAGEEFGAAHRIADREDPSAAPPIPKRRPE